MRLRESEINFVFCEWELYVGTASEQKTESTKSGLSTTFKPLFYKCIFDFISARASPCPTSSLYDNFSAAWFSHFIDSLKSRINFSDTGFFKIYLFFCSLFFLAFSVLSCCFISFCLASSSLAFCSSRRLFSSSRAFASSYIALISS